MLTNAEIIASCLGTYGAIIMVVPEFFENYCFCCCMNKKKSVGEDDYVEFENMDKSEGTDDIKL